MFELRDYQTEELNQIVESMKQGNRSIMVQSPPRTGKTVVMAEIAKRTTDNGNRILFVVHRKEIVDQVKATFGANGVDMNLAQIGMVQTFTRRLPRLAVPDVIFVDEAHHVLAKSYRRILDFFPNAIKLLFTATPYRLDGEGFTDIADDLIVGKDINWLIQKGNLAPIDYYAPKQINVKELRIRKGEFTPDSIKKAFKPKIYGNAVSNYLKLASDKQAIAYAYNVESAQTLADEFNAHGISAAAVSGKTPKGERLKIVTAFKNGEIQVVTNAELFTEGLDLPNVDCVIMLRPTQSLSLYLQFAMRSMNPREGKTAIIIDHVGNVERFGLPTDKREWTLTGRNKKEHTNQSVDIPGVTVCEQCFSTFYRKGDICPNCGKELPVHKKVIEVDENAKLEKVEAKKVARIAKKMMDDKVAMNVAGKNPSELHSMAELQAYAKLHDFKPGWAFYQAKERGLLH